MNISMCVYSEEKKKIKQIPSQLKQFSKFHYIFKCTHIGRGSAAGICRRERENHATIWSNICYVFNFIHFNSLAHDRIPSNYQYVWTIFVICRVRCVNIPSFPSCTTYQLVGFYGNVTKFFGNCDQMPF